MSLSRRKFLGVTALSSATLLAGNTHANEDKINCDESYGVLVDTVVCIGCRKCEWACNQEHGLSDKDLASFEDKSVFKEHRRPDKNAYTVVNEYHDPANPSKPYTLKVQCMHCNEPACVSACIVGAFEKTASGPVVYDAWKCIGCRYCIIACPFQIPAYEYDNPLDPQVRKCTFCNERLDRGELPACASICPNEALTFGPRRELIDLAHSRFRANPGRYYEQVYGEHEVGGTSWMYLTAVDTKLTELPTLTDEPTPPLTETIQHGIFKSFVPPVALYALLGLIMHSKGDKNEEQEEK
jgi:formate dehydrogenase iron-sulfur subunit